MASNEVDALLLNQTLDPQTNLPIDERSEVDQLLFMSGEGAAFRAPSSVQMGAYGPEGRRIGESKYDVNILPEDILYGNNLEAIRSANQPGWDMFGNALVQSFNEVVGGTIEGLGYLLDVGAWTNAFRKDEYDFGNWFSDIGKDLKEKGREVHPVYTSFEPGAFKPGEWSWWMSNASSIASSLSLAIPSWGAMKALSLVGKGMKVLDGMGDLGKVVGKGMTRAVASRHMESMMESSQLFDEIYQKNLDKGMSEVEARKNAAKGASQVYNRNWAMLIQDIPQYILMGTKGVLPRASIKNTAATAKAMGKDVTPIHISNAIKYGGDMLGEALEEGYQYVVQKEGEYASMIALNPEKDLYSKWNRIKEYTDDGEFMTSMTMGALGAGAMHVGARVADRAMKSIADRTRLQEQEIDGQVKPKIGVDRRVQDINGFGAMFSKNYKNISRAYQSNNEDRIRAANTEGLADMYSKSSSVGNMEHLREFFTAMQNPSEEDLQRWPEMTPEVVAAAKGDITKIIQDSVEFEKQYNKNMKKVEKGQLKSPYHAALLTKEEYLLGEYEQHKADITGRVNEAKAELNKTPYHNMSDNFKDTKSLEFSKEAVSKQLSWFKRELKTNKELVPEEKESINFAIKLLDERNKALAEEIKAKKAAKTEEEAANDEGKTVPDEVYNDYRNALHADRIIESSIDQVRNTISNIWDGTLDEDLAPPKPEETSDKLKGIPQEDDYVEHTDPTTQIVRTAKVAGIDPEKPDVYYIAPVNENMQPLKDENGEVIIETVDLDNLEINISMTLARDITEPVNEDEAPDSEEVIAERIARKGLRSVSRSVSYIDRGDITDDIFIRNEDLREYASNPINDMEDARFEFDIYIPDFDETQPIDEINDEYAVRFWKRHLELMRAIKDGTLTSNQIDTILKADKKKGLDENGNEIEYEDFNSYPVDKIPINVKITVPNRSKPFTGGLFYHDSSYDEMVIPNRVVVEGTVAEYIEQEQLKTRETRSYILRTLMEGNGIVMDALEGEVKSIGHPNHAPVNKKDRNRPLTEVFGKKDNEIDLFIGNNDNVPANGTIELENIVTSGSVYTKTNKTANGQEALVKLNYAKLSEEHADILLDAIIQRYTFGKKGGSMKPSTDSRVENLNVGEVIQILALFGEEITSKFPEKQLYVTYEEGSGNRPILVFGEDNRFSLFNPKTQKAMRSAFIKWATVNKNYQVYIKNDELEISALNRQFKKPFKLGSMENDGSMTYQQFVIRNNMVLSDLEEYKNTGSLFEGPVLEIDIDSSRIIKYNKVKVESGKTASKKKATPAEKEKETAPPPIDDNVRKTQDVKLDENSQIVVTNANQLGNLPVGSRILISGYTIKRLNKEPIDVEHFVTIGEIDGNGNMSVEPKLMSTDVYFRMDKKKAGDPALYNLLELAKSRVPNTPRIVAQVPKGFNVGELEKIPEPVTEQPTIEKKAKEIVKEEEQPKPTPPPSKVIEPKKKRGLPNTGRLAGHEDDGNEILRTFKGQKDYVPQDLFKELSKVRKMLGKKVANNFELVDDLIYVAQGGRQAFASYHHDVIKLFKAAETGTAYHEAFHRVTLGYLNDVEREKLYNEARKRWPERLEDANDRETDEYLAERFRDYILSKGKINFLGWVNKVFQRLYNFIRSWFVADSRLTNGDIDTLFNSIYHGKFRRNSIIQDNYKILDRADYWRLDIPTINTADQGKKVIKGLTRTLFELNEVTDISHIDKLNWAVLQNHLVDKIKEMKADLLTNAKLPTNHKDKWDSEDQGIVNGWVELYESILGYNPKTNRNENFPAIRELMLSYMKSIGIDTYGDVNPEVEVGEDGLTQHDVMSHEISVKANAQGSIKLMIATARKSNKIDPFTNMKEFVDYNKAWSILLDDLADLDNIEQMIKELEKSVNNEERFFYYDILKRLKTNGIEAELFRNQFEVTMRKHRHNFINLLISETKQGNYNYRFSNANLNEGTRLAKLTWSQNLYLSDLVDTPANKEASVNNKKVAELKKEFESLRGTFNSVKGKPSFNDQEGLLKANTVRILNRLGIEADDRVLSEYKAINGLSDQDLFTELFKQMNVIFKNVLTKYKTPNTILVNSELDELAQAFARAYPERTNDMVLGPSNAAYYKYSNNSHVTAITRKLNKDKKHVQRMLASRGMANSQFLAQSLAGSNIQILTFAGAFLEKTGDRGRDYFGITPVEDYIMKVNAYLSGYIPFPTMADKRTYYLMQGLNTLNTKDITFDDSGEFIFSDDIIDVFMGYAKDEFNRIQGVAEDIKMKDKIRDKLVLNYHYTLDPSGRRNYKNANGLKYHLFPGLSTSKWEPEVVRAHIVSGLKKAISKELKYAENIQAISRAKDGTLTTGLMGVDVVKAYQERYGVREDSIKALVASYALKAMQGNIEIYKLYVGDPAFFKSKNDKVSDDIGKRLGALIGSGEEMVLHTDHWGDTLTDTTYNVATLKTQYLESKYYGDLVEMHTKRLKETTSLSDKEIKEKVQKTLKPYLDIDQADGQTFVSPEFYRSVAIRIGEWTQLKEDAYKLLTAKRKLGVEDELKSMGIIMQPVKPVYYSQDFETFSGQETPVVIYDKMSMAPLFRRVVEGTQAEILLDRMEATGQFEGATKIHMIKMDSATKVGNRGMTEMFSDPKTQNTVNISNLKNIPIFPQYYASLRRQLATDPHSKPNRKLGTQFIKIGMGNLRLKGNYPNGKTGAKIAKEINRGLGILSKHGNKQLKFRLGYKNGKIDQKRLAEELRKEAEKANMAREIIDSIKYDEATGEMYLQMDSMPNRRWYQSRLISLVNKYVIDRNFPGGQYIQMSNLGLKKGDLEVQVGNIDELKFIRLEDGKIKPMECLVSVSLFKNAIPGYKNMTWQEKVDYIKAQNLDILGYRIPTQGQNSTVALKVGGILPEQAGETIVLPAEFTKLTGSDFDIDKLFLARPNYTRENGKMVELKYLTGKENADLSKQYNRMLWYLWDAYRDHFGKEFRRDYYKKKYYKKESERLYDSDAPMINSELAAFRSEWEALESRLDDASEEDFDRMTDQIEYLKKKYDDRIEIKDTLHAFKIEDKAQLDTITNNIEKELISLGLLPTFDEFKELSEVERNTPAAIQNMILNNYRAILTSEEHILNTTTPLVDSQQVQFLEQLADDVASLYGEDKSAEMLDLVTLHANNESKHRYASGKGGVAPFALHNTNHVMTQLAEVSLPNIISDLQNTNADHNVSVSEIEGIDNIAIIDWLSAMIDSHVDLPTNPFILNLNINDITYDVTSYMLRTGMGSATFEFLAQPIIRRLSEVYLQRHGSKLLPDYNVDKAIREVRDEFAAKIGLLNSKATKETKDGIESEIGAIKSKLLSKEHSLEKDVLAKKYKWSDPEYIKIQLAVLDKFIDVKAQAAILSDLVQGSTVDTKGYGSNIAEYKLFMRRADKVRKRIADGDIFGAEKIVPTGDTIAESDLFTADYFIYGANLIGELFADQSIMAAESFEAMVDKIMSVVPFAKSADSYLLNKVYNELFSSLVFKNIISNPDFFGLNRENAMALMFGEFKKDESGNIVLNQKNNIYQQFVDLKTSHPEIKENPLISRLENIILEDSGLRNFFTFDRGDFSDPWETEDIITGWRDLIDSPESAISRFGKNLYMYSMITTGMNIRANSFWNYVPPDVQKSISMKGRTVSFDEGVKELRKKLQEPMVMTESVDTMNEVFKHVPELKPDVTKSNRDAVIKGTDHRIFTPFSKDLRVGKNLEGKEVYIPYITFRKKLYKYAGYSTQGKYNQPIYREVNKKGFAEGGRNLIEYGYEHSLLNENFMKDNEGNLIWNDFKEDAFIKDMMKRFNDEFVYMSDEDIYFSQVVEEDVVDEIIEPIENIVPEPKPSQMTEEQRDVLSSPEAPINIFTDGSHVNKQDPKSVATFGATFRYNDKDYNLSRGAEWGRAMNAKYGKVSNPTAEVAALVEVLKIFKDTDEHLRIITDYEGVASWDGLADVAVPHKHSKRYKAKDPWIKDLVKEAEDLIKQIQDNGGSVMIQWVPARVKDSKAMMAKHADIFMGKDGFIKQSLVDKVYEGNERADTLAKDQESFDHMSSILELRKPLWEEPPIFEPEDGEKEFLRDSGDEYADGPIDPRHPIKDFNPGTLVIDEAKNVWEVISLEEWKKETRIPNMTSGVKARFRGHVGEKIDKYGHPDSVEYIKPGSVNTMPENMKVEEWVHMLTPEEIQEGKKNNKECNE